ncbi:hypothetical protein [Thiolapillus sp.]
MNLKKCPSAAGKLLCISFALQGTPLGAASVSELEQALQPEKPSDPSSHLPLPPVADDQLVEALQAAGWSASRTTDGSLILHPEKATNTDESASTSRENRWAQLKQQLEAGGWQTFEDSDGYLVLKPPKSPPKGESQTKTDHSAALHDIKDQLKTAGWRVEESSDHGLLLYPPGENTHRKAPHCAGIITRYRPLLPVDSWQKAHDVADSWLNAQDGLQASVGKIRRILGIHIISIVSSSPPYRLLHQIAIRNSDGAVIVLD